MSDESVRAIVDLTSQEFGSALRIKVTPSNEEFVVTRIGRIDYAVSIQRGLAYTRPQLIEKYENTTVVYVVTPRSR